MENVIAITPAQRLDPQIAIAACRSGALGILDLGLREDPSARTAAIGKLAKAAGGSRLWGLRWDTFGTQASGLEHLGGMLSGRVPVLVLAASGPEETNKLRKAAKRLAHRVLLEVNDLDAAQAAQAAGYDGLIVKGHEAGGRVSKRASFILLQEFHARLDVPYWLQGGIGLCSAAAAVLAGAAGVVLGEQLWLADEGPFDAPEDRTLWSQLDGSETVLVGDDNELYRLFGRAGRSKLHELEPAVAEQGAWRELLLRFLLDDSDPVIPVGQDIAFAGAFAERYRTVGRIITAVRTSIDTGLKRTKVQHVLAPDSPLARLHGTRFPIVQGPMTRVSDVAPFARAVAEAGGLPFLALAVMRGPQVVALLTKTKAMMGDTPWGVGILGFMPLELRQEQLDVIREVKPPFAIVAGGRPSQARELEGLGIATYLHVPSPGLLKMFIKDGARKFIFEGSECGGHTGPRTSFILWESAIEILANAELNDPESVQVLFAGGIHDPLSAAMVSVLAAPLVARGMKVGVLMGTAYLFTNEVVNSGAVIEEFQNQAIACRDTALLQSGVGVYTRCAQTPFCDEFNRTRRELVLGAKSDEESLIALELLNIGRLRLASKGIKHNSHPMASDNSDRYLQVDAKTQRREGMYMLGEVARLRSDTLSIAELHESVSLASAAVFASGRRPAGKRVVSRTTRDDIAIIGMACVLPGSPNVRRYWQSIIGSVDAIREVGDERWRPADFFDPMRATRDKVYSKWGGFLDDVQFDPTRYGIPPASLKSIEPMQLLALEVARLAFEDAGLDRRPFPRDRTATIFASGGMNDLGTIYIFRTLLAHYLPKVAGVEEQTKRQIMQGLYEHELPQWTEDSFPGFLGNVVAGRVANRLDLQGTNFVVDAACASSLAALDVGIKQLRNRDADVALIGAIDGTNNAVAFMAFAQTHALSPRGRCRPFDHSADGIAIGEGVAALVLKRQSDAERDGDRIHALIKGTGSSSDGRNRSLTAPHPQGQVKALERAYEDARVDPATVELIEAHGTGTAVGDKSEIESLNLAFGGSAAARQYCAVGSVKSTIGHTKVTAGLAGVIKSILALKHRVLPPTLGVDRPNSQVDFSQTPFYISTETRPWFTTREGQPRRSGVSAFGFGGTNFHTVLEEYNGAYRDSDALDLTPRAAEVFTFVGSSRAEISQSAGRLMQGLTHPDAIDLAQLGYSLYREQLRGRTINGARMCRLALLATSVPDLKQKLDLVLDQLRDKAEIKHPQGVYYRESVALAGGVCCLFPGQGSQRINMLRDLVVALPGLHHLFERADALLTERLPQPLSRYIYPLPVFSDEERARQQAALNATQVTQPALGVVELAALEVLKGYGLQPDFVAGHSYGEYVALCAAGAIGTDTLFELSELRGRIAAEAARTSPGAMAAVDADGARVAALITQHGLGISVANLNAPDQTVIAGSTEAIEAAARVLGKASMRVKQLPVTAAFHSPLMRAARDSLAAQLTTIEFDRPRVPVFSNTTAGPYPQSAAEVRALLARHLCEPVRFVEEIDHLYAAGARVFIETGPGLVLSGMVGRILADRPHTSLGIDVPGRPGWLQLGHMLSQAFTIGLAVQFGPWFHGRGLKDHSVDQVLAQARSEANPGPLIWRVNGGRAVPWQAPAAAKPSRVTSVTTAPTETAPAKAMASATLVPSEVLQLQIPFNANRRYTMENSEAALPLAANLGCSESQYTQIQQSVVQLMDLQHQQQETLRCFLDFQANLIGAGLHRLQGTPAMAVPRASVHAASGAGPAILQSVPPAPVLPKQVVAVVTGESGISQAASPVASRATEPAVRPVPADGAVQPSAPSIAMPSNGGTGALVPTEQFKADLLRAVSERTGYPQDMLDLDAHMEADLGIDSIKRIEVFSGLKDHHNLLEGRDEETVLEELSGLKTLNEIVAWYDTLRNTSSQAGGPAAPKKSQTPPSPEPAETVESHVESFPDPVRRYAVKPLAAPLDGQAKPKPFPFALPILIAGSVTPLNDALRAALAREGHAVWQLIPAMETRALDGDRLEIDLSTPAAIEQLGRLLPVTGQALGALINLIGQEAHGDNEQCDHHLEEARSLFLIVKALERELIAGSRTGGGYLINITGFDGQFGLRRSRAYSIEAAGTLGVAKSVAREWPDLRVKCIDIDPAMGPSQGLDAVVSELRHGDSSLEIGFTQEGRWRIDLQANGVASGDLSKLELDAGAVLLVTGGAYGITADIARAMAKRYRPRLVLVGRSPLPETEPAITDEIQDPAELKRFLIGELQAKTGGRVRPAEVDRVLKRLLKDRQIRSNLAAMRECGAEVEYHPLDVSDADAFGRLIDGTYAKWGRIDGVLHGAGIIDDKRIRDKSLESFSTVFNTKVVPALVMARKLRPESLKFLVFFSSIAGRFGSAGQCDYSAANEVLNKLADRLSHEWPGVHTVAMNWGPWDAGMMSDELRGLYAARNIRPIPLATGTRYCLDELEHGNTGEPEIVIAASLEQIAELAPRRTQSRSRAPERRDGASFQTHSAAPDSATVTPAADMMTAYVQEAAKAGHHG